MGKNSIPLKFNILKTCNTSRARAGVLELPHGIVNTPIFMPVGTKGSLKGLTPEQIKETGCNLMLCNTYHLGNQPGGDMLDKAGGVHEFMKWSGNVLTDSGGLQMVSLSDICTITEEGAKFENIYKPGTTIFLTPEESISIQNCIGADIIMALDDVIDVKSTDYERFKVATGRTTRWFDRCVTEHKKPEKQALFPIVQGGLDKELRLKSIAELKERTMLGYAIGGLSGKETKDNFWRIVNLCTSAGVGLPADKPRYLMGVGYPIDVLVCVALGVDMFDCVYPSRTARFFTALTKTGLIKLKKSKYKGSTEPIQRDCTCYTCKNYTIGAIRAMSNRNIASFRLITLHNIHFMMQFCKDIHSAIKNNCFPEFAINFIKEYTKNGDWDSVVGNADRVWIHNALRSVNINADDIL